MPEAQLHRPEPAANLPVFEDYLNHPGNTAPADLLTDIYLPLAG